MKLFDEVWGLHVKHDISHITFSLNYEEWTR